VNLILFEPAELHQPLAKTDRRAAHLLDVLRRKTGDSFDVGVINGPRGKATLRSVGPEHLSLDFTWDNAHPPPPDPLTLIVGLPRPQTARDILRDATTLGVSALHFVRTEKSERSYAQSTLWTSGEWRRHVVIGAEQAFDTRIPEVTFDRALADALNPRSSNSLRLGLDNYEAANRLGDVELRAPMEVVLAIGGERGWSAADRDALRAHHFELVHLGTRVLRTETAVVAALSLLRAKLRLM
jgi:16S rRNA (uracil1498-N3)-methyltransferase